jgi:anti-sigma B factor antagonist
VFEASVSSTTAIAIVSIVGDLDLSTLVRFRSEILQAMDQSGPSLIIDMSSVDVFEPVVLGVVFEAVKRSAAREGSVVLVHPNDRILSDLRATGVDRILEIAPTTSEALERLRPGSDE